MKAKPEWASIAFVMMTFLMFSVLPLGLAEDTTRTYKLLNPNDGTFSYTMTVTIPQNLNEYYQGLNHKSASDPDFPKFVTPSAVKPISDILRQIYSDDEDFANSVLTLVHQISYEETLPEYYPVETLLKNGGDCDMFSLLAASILKAGGLNVVLLHYASEEHMNIGINLERPPQDVRQNIYSIESKNVTYYVAECTSSAWTEGWRVGESPNDLKNATVTIITLASSEQTSPGAVSASLQKPQKTKLTMEVLPAFTIEGSTLTLKGQIDPAMPDQNVTLYFSVDRSNWGIIGTTITQSNGQFTYDWKSEKTGEINFQASLAGNDQYAGTTSESKNATILPIYLTVLAALALGAVIICVVIYVGTRKRRRTNRLSETDLPLEI